MMSICIFYDTKVLNLTQALKLQMQSLKKEVNMLESKIQIQMKKLKDKDQGILTNKLYLTV